MAKRFRTANGTILTQEAGGWRDVSSLYPNRPGFIEHGTGRRITEDLPVYSTGSRAIEGCHLLTFDELAVRYCARQLNTPDDLLATFRGQVTTYQPDGWFMLECQMLGSSAMGSLVILPWGPRNTFKEIPTGPVSPRGLASDMSIAVACILAGELPEKAAPWEAPPAPPVKKKRKR